MPCRASALAEPFEGLRDASDRMLAERGARPKVFLANLGRPSDFTARAAFAKNFFEAGGIEAVTNDGFGSPEEMMIAFRHRAPGSPACAPPTRSMPNTRPRPRGRSRAPPMSIWRDGRAEPRERTQSAGVGTFVFAGCDALAALGAAHEILRAKA